MLRTGGSGLKSRLPGEDGTKSQAKLWHASPDSLLEDNPWEDFEGKFQDAAPVFNPQSSSGVLAPVHEDDEAGSGRDSRSSARREDFYRHPIDLEGDLEEGRATTEEVGAGRGEEEKVVRRRTNLSWTSSIDQDGTPDLLMTPLGSTISTPGAKKTRSLIGCFACGYSAAMLESANDPLPIRPWCGRCEPSRPMDVLALKPEDIGIASLARKEAKEEVERRIQEKAEGYRMLQRSADNSPYPGTPWSASASPANISRQVSWTSCSSSEERPSRKNKLKDLRRKLINTNIQMAAGLSFEATEQLRKNCTTVPYICASKVVNDVQLKPKPHTSKFSAEQVEDELSPPVFLLLTRRELGNLESWAVNHIKSQRVRLCALAQLYMPTQTKRKRSTLKSTTLCELLRSQNAGKFLDRVQRQFLRKELAKLPFFCKVPDDLFEHVIRKVRVHSYVTGATIFEQGEDIDGLYVLVQGDLHLTSKDSKSLEWTKRMEAPAVILEGDLLDLGSSRPFLLKPMEKRVWSYTASVPVMEEDSMVVKTLFVPVLHIVQVSECYRRTEQKELEHVLRTEFAVAARLLPAVCIKNRDAFEIRTAYKNQMIFLEGSKPDIDRAFIGLVLQGQISVRKTRRDGSRGSQNRHGASHPRNITARNLIGGEALYGEAYHASLFSAADDTKLVCISVRNYFDKLLIRPYPLERPHYVSRLQAERPVSPSEASEDWEDPDRGSVHEIRKPMGKAEKLFAVRKRQFRKAMDKEQLKQTDWKLLLAKAEMPKRTPVKALPAPMHCAPLGKLAFGQSSAHEFVDFCYPREGDLFPKVQRNVLLALRGDNTLKDRAVGRTAASIRLEKQNTSAISIAMYEDRAPTPCGSSTRRTASSASWRAPCISGDDTECHAEEILSLTDGARPPSRADSSTTPTLLPALCL